MTDALAALVALTAMEIVLGIDNLVFIAIVASKLPAAQQPRARLLGLVVALVLRLALLFTLKWLMGLTKPFATIAGVPLSGKSLILLLGGLFLIGKSTYEIHNKLEGAHEERKVKAVASFWWVVAQIALIDMVFALDSVITAVGMARQLWVMVTAIVLCDARHACQRRPRQPLHQPSPDAEDVGAQFPLAHRGDVGGGRVRQTH
jgi:predicted tellurium resistance membrane protein TerC